MSMNMCMLLKYVLITCVYALYLYHTCLCVLLGHQGDPKEPRGQDRDHSTILQPLRGNST